MRPARLSFFAAASWLVPFFVFVMMLNYERSRPRKEPLGFVPDFGPLLIQLGIVAGVAFTIGLLSFLRRERLSWVAALPCFLGGFYICAAALLAFLKMGEVAVRVMVHAPYLTMGTLLALNGVFFLAWLLPRKSARLAREEEADDLGETDTRMKVKVVKLFGVATLIVGVVFILIHAFELF
jgi:hypothetical protein